MALLVAPHFWTNACSEWLVESNFVGGFNFLKKNPSHWGTLSQILVSFFVRVPSKAAPLPPLPLENLICTFQLKPGCRGLLQQNWQRPSSPGFDIFTKNPDQQLRHHFSGNFRILNWRYLPYMRPLFEANVSEYNITTQYGLIWYSTSILGSWNFHWSFPYIFLLKVPYIWTPPPPDKQIE